MRYVGGPLAGSFTVFPAEGMVLDGVYDESPVVPETGRAERYVLRRLDDDWAFVYAGPADDPDVAACARCGTTMPDGAAALSHGWLRETPENPEGCVFVNYLCTECQQAAAGS